MADEWFADLRSVRHVSVSTVRGYQVAIREFCRFITDPGYGWAVECERRFGTYPVQVVTEVNSAVHVADSEAGPRTRTFSRLELQALFDYADEQVGLKRAQGRKGWLPAFRDATLLKVAYGFGLRRNETRMLDAADFGRNPHARVRGVRRRLCEAREGEQGLPTETAQRAHRLAVDRRHHAAVVHRDRPAFGADDNTAAWPSERGRRVGVEVLDHALSDCRDALGLDRGLDFHSLRRSYVTHLIEDGWDPKFVQDQLGHEHASTTSMYTCVSSDFRTRTLRRVLDSMVAEAP